MRQVNQWQRTAARDFYLRHPDASISEVVKATGISQRTVVRARNLLVKEGLLTSGRRTDGAADLATTAAALPAPEPDAPVEPRSDAPPEGPMRGPGRPKKQSELLDDEAMRQMSQMLDELADCEDDEVTRKRMLKQTQRFAFDPSLHPDTRMSASQLWAKLVDMAKAQDLGPGVPLTLEAAVERATDFLKACGPTVAVPAFYKAFNLEADGGERKDDAAAAPGGAAEAAGPTGHDGGAAQAAHLRAERVGDGGRPTAQHPDLPGPEAGRPGEAGDPRVAPHLGPGSPWS